MSAYLVFDNGTLISVGTVLADPLPEGITTTEITDDQYAGITGGWLAWDGSALVDTDKPSPEDQATYDANRVAIEAAMTDAIELLLDLAAYPAVAQVPAGTLTTAQLATIARAMRDEVQANRAGAQQVATTLAQAVRYLRGDFSTGA